MVEVLVVVKDDEAFFEVIRSNAMELRVSVRLFCFFFGFIF